MPPAGIEPALPPPEGGALSPELWGLRLCHLTSRKAGISFCVVVLIDFEQS